VFTNIDRNEIIEKIKSLWWKQTKPNTLMKRVFFEHPNDKKGSYIRVRDEWDKITCTYKKNNFLLIYEKELWLSYEYIINFQPKSPFFNQNI